MTPRLFWSAVTDRSLVSAAEAVRASAGNLADLVGFQQHSDLSLVLEWEVRGGRVADLRARWSLLFPVRGPETVPWEADEEGTLVLQVTSSQGTGDLVREVPAAPG